MPAARDLFTALKLKQPGSTRVVCQGRVPKYPKKKIKKAKKSLQGDALKKKIKKLKKRYRKKVNKNHSIKALDAAVARARSRGVEIRPSQPRESFSKAQAKRYKKFNRKLLRRCQFKEIQPAVTASGNNDRVVVMPGIYTEPTSRARPHQRSEVRRARGDERPARRQRLAPDRRQLLPLRRDLPERPEPGRGDRAPAGPARRRSPRSTTATASPTRAPASAATCRSRARASAPTTSSSTPATSPSGNGGPAEPVKDVVHPRRPCRRIRPSQHDRPPRREHGIYPHEVDGYRARALQGLPQRGVRASSRSPPTTA